MKKKAENINVLRRHCKVHYQQILQIAYDARFQCSNLVWNKSTWFMGIEKY